METNSRPEEVEGLLTRLLGGDLSLSRRQFLRATGLSVAALSALSPLLAGASARPMIIVDHAEGLVIADPTRCVGCRRCELACTEFNDGQAKPSMSRIKVGRNLNFGPLGVSANQGREGNWGGGLIVQDLCKQCPHPVPCADACPNDAIVALPPLNARVVDEEKCVGCSMCQRACPWDMISFDENRNKATKCSLCSGHPKCVEACPAEALRYVKWRDLSREMPRRVTPTAVMTPEKAAACLDCHRK